MARSALFTTFLVLIFAVFGPSSAVDASNFGFNSVLNRIFVGESSANSPSPVELAAAGSASALSKRSPPIQEKCVFCPDEATGTCVYLSSNSSNCGACGKACPTGQACSEKTCRTYADYCKYYNQDWCGSTNSPYCARLSDDAEHCGSCNTKCSGSTPKCEGGQCVQCYSFEKYCNGKCVTIWDSPNCGGCGVTCPAGQLCNSYPNGTYDPTKAVCEDPSCDQWSTYCPGIGCVNIKTNDNKNCGACGKACAENEYCQGGMCTFCTNITYGKPQICDGKCVFTDYDLNNCQKCGNKCAMGLECLSDGCVCFSNLGPDPKVVDCTLANGTVNHCRDLHNDINNCGSCGNRCPSRDRGSAFSAYCDAGTCYCGDRYNPYPTAFPELCGTGDAAVCVDKKTDVDNCGACGNKCKPAETCFEGKCYTCAKMNLVECPQLNRTCMTQSMYDYMCPGGTSYTPTSTSSATGGTATVTTTVIPPKPTFSVRPGDPVCLRSCGDKQNYVLVRKIVQDGTRETGIQCLGSNPTNCAWFTDAKCTQVAQGEVTPDPSYDTGYVCTQTAAGWCGAAYSYLWVSPTTPIPADCPAPVPPTNNEPYISVGSYSCVRSCVDKGNYLLMRSQVIHSSGVMTMQCSGTKETSCGWFSDAACTQIVPGETGGGNSGIVCSEVLAGWCEAGWDALVLNTTQGSCTFITTVTATGTVAPPTSATVVPPTSVSGSATATATATAPVTSTTSKPSAANKLPAIGNWIATSLLAPITLVFIILF